MTSMEPTMICSSTANNVLVTLLRVVLLLVALRLAYWGFVAGVAWVPSTAFPCLGGAIACLAVMVAMRDDSQNQRRR